MDYRERHITSVSIQPIRGQSPDLASLLNHNIPYEQESPLTFHGLPLIVEEINRAQMYLDLPQTENHKSGGEYYQQYHVEPDQSGLSPRHCPPSTKSQNPSIQEDAFASCPNQNNFGVLSFERKQCARYPNFGVIHDAGSLELGFQRKSDDEDREDAED